MRRRTAYAGFLVLLVGVLAFFFLPVFPIGGSGTVIAYAGGCDICPEPHPVSFNYHWSAIASPVYHLFTCGESYFGSGTFTANMSFTGSVSLVNYSGVSGWYCGHYSGPH